MAEDNHPQIEEPPNHPQTGSYIGERPALSVHHDRGGNQPQPRVLRPHGVLMLPFRDRPRRVFDVFKDPDGNFFTNDPLLRGSFVSLDSVIHEASRSSEELVAAATESASALTLQEPDVTSSEDLIGVVSSEELITVSPQTLSLHDTTEDSQPSGHCYSASSGPTIFLRSPPEWYFTFFIRKDRGGCFRMYPDMGGPFQSLKEADDTIDAHIVKLQSQATYNEHDDVPSVERLIRRCVFYPDGTPKRGPNCPARKNPNYREHNLVQAILDQYNDDHNLLGDLAHELKGDVSFQWIHEASACYYHFNFTTKTKEAGVANLFFAEVSQMQRDGDWVLSCCCMLGPNDNGGCYGCASDDSPDIKHPSRTDSYTGGHVDEYLRFGGDPFSDSDDDEEVQVAKLRIKYKRRENWLKTKCCNVTPLVKI